MSRVPVTIEAMLRQLTAAYPGVDFTAGERSEGFWIRAVALTGNWTWERFRMTSVGAAHVFAQVALSEFYGN